ncbi:uncharacterized protein LOC131619087 [Vicia villosa]|uniref:uncharacterized protein LOC131619087 n=1 Tax=Vicia villosa TaxID=3911 RepID=UPI00273C5FCA|nr:uncharacterized protein LOC131619087 [Vicia villosa]
MSLSKDELQSSLEAHEQRMDERGSYKGKAEIALQVRFNERSKAKCGAKQLESKGDEAKVARQEVDDEATLLMMITDECDGMTEVLDSSCKSRDSSCSSAENATVLSSEQNVMISVRDGTQGNEECIGQLLEKGYNIRLEDKILRVVDASGVLILKAPMATNRTFKVELKVLEHRCLATAASREEWLWHYRLDYLNFRDLKALQQEGMVTGLPHINVPAELCRTKAHLEVVYSDVCGPVQVDTFGGN